MSSILSVTCEEPEGKFERKVYPFTFNPPEVVKLYDKFSRFPVIFGRELKDAADFVNFFTYHNLSGGLEPMGLVWTIDDMVGAFYMNELSDTEASVHYSFFDRRHKGREPLVKAMLRYIFKTYGFVRLNVYIPAYVGMVPRLFIERCGFRMEGRKRKCSWWKGQWFDVYLYGILPEDLEDGCED